MGVRVRVRLRAGSAEVETSALVNSGYEVEEPEVLLPRRLAEYLGLELGPPVARAATYETPFGFQRVVLVPRALAVHLEGVCAEVAGVSAAVADFEREVLISDALAEALGIQLISIARGLWRHSDDPPDSLRESASPEYW